MEVEGGRALAPAAAARRDHVRSNGGTGYSEYAPHVIVALLARKLEELCTRVEAEEREVASRVEVVEASWAVAIGEDGCSACQVGRLPPPSFAGGRMTGLRVWSTGAPPAALAPPSPGAAAAAASTRIPDLVI
ncbi:unnamed protein product [Urochloa humidicola]